MWRTPDFLSIGIIQGNWFLTHYVLTGRDGGQGNLLMELVRRGNNNRIYRRVLQELVVIGINLLYPGCGKSLLQSGLIHIAQGHHFSLGRYLDSR
jgi:hypothetical protein